MMPRSGHEHGQLGVTTILKAEDCSSRCRRQVDRRGMIVWTLMTGVERAHEKWI